MRIRLGVKNMAKLLSGKEVAASLNESICERAEALRARGITPKLAIVRCGEKPSDLAYVNQLSSQKTKQYSVVLSITKVL